MTHNLLEKDKIKSIKIILDIACSGEEVLKTHHRGHRERNEAYREKYIIKNQYVDLRSHFS